MNINLPFTILFSNLNSKTDWKFTLLILSPLGRQCKKDHVHTWMLHYYLEGIFHD